MTDYEAAVSEWGRRKLGHNQLRPCAHEQVSVFLDSEGECIEDSSWASMPDYYIEVYCGKCYASYRIGDYTFDMAQLVSEIVEAGRSIE